MQKYWSISIIDSALSENGLELLNCNDSSFEIIYILLVAVRVNASTVQI